MSKLKRAGADRTVAPFESVGQLAVQYIGQPVAFDAMSEIMNVSEGISVDAVRVTRNSSLAGRTIREVDVQRHRLLLFGVLSERKGPSDRAFHSYSFAHQRFFFNPRPGFRFEVDDLLILFGHDLNLSHFKKWLAKGAR